MNHKSHHDLHNKEIPQLSPQLLTVKEVAERLNVSTSCVYALVARCELNSMRVGLGRGTIRVRESDLNEYLTSRSNGHPITKDTPKPPRHKLKHIRL